MIISAEVQAQPRENVGFHVPKEKNSTNSRTSGKRVRRKRADMSNVLRLRRILSFGLAIPLLILLCFVVQAGSCQAADWKLVKQGEGVVVYTRDT